MDWASFFWGMLAGGAVVFAGCFLVVYELTELMLFVGEVLFGGKEDEDVL